MATGDTQATPRWPTARLILGLVVVFALFDRVATWTGSTYGQAGLLIGALVVAAVLLVERLLFGRPFAQGVRLVGLGRPAGTGMLAAVVVSLLLLATFPIYSSLAGARLQLYPGWLLLLPGLFAQAGIAEEVLFRGYLFGHLRQGRGFWRAALLSVPPFLLVHLPMFFYMPPAVAAAAVLTSLVISFPLARLFELGGRTIWAPAVLHWVIQGAIKLLPVAPGDQQSDQQLRLTLVWLVLSMLLPWLAFAFGRSRRPAVVRPMVGAGA
jgi:membrane protease YdiL (CAAX protease family)